MTDLLWLSDEQFNRIQPYFPRSHGVPRVDDHRVVSGIVFVIRNGLRWRDAPREYGPHKTLYNRFIRWSRMGVFDRIFASLAGQSGKPDRLIISRSTARRRACSKKGCFPPYRAYEKPAPGLNGGRPELKLHAVTDGDGKPLILLLSEGQMSDHKGVRLMLDALPPARSLTGDRGYDSDGFRKA